MQRSHLKNAKQISNFVENVTSANIKASFHNHDSPTCNLNVQQCMLDRTLPADVKIIITFKSYKYCKKINNITSLSSLRENIVTYEVFL